MLYKRNIVSFIYKEKLRIGEVQSVRSLKKEPLEHASKSEFHEGSKYLYTILDYDNNMKTFYSGGMSSVIILSGGGFINTKLQKRFSQFRHEYKNKVANQTSGLNSSGDDLRLSLSEIKVGDKIKFKLYSGLTRVAIFTKWHNINDKAIVEVYYPGIEVDSKVEACKIKSISIIEVRQVPTKLDYNLPKFEIPSYEVECGYTLEFRQAFDFFISRGAKYRFHHENGAIDELEICDVKFTINDILLTVNHTCGTRQSTTVPIGAFRQIYLLK